MTYIHSDVSACKRCAELSAAAGCSWRCEPCYAAHKAAQKAQAAAITARQEALWARALTLGWCKWSHAACEDALGEVIEFAHAEICGCRIIGKTAADTYFNVGPCKPWVESIAFAFYTLRHLLERVPPDDADHLVAYAVERLRANGLPSPEYAQLIDLIDRFWIIDNLLPEKADRRRLKRHLSTEELAWLDEQAGAPHHEPTLEELAAAERKRDKAATRKVMAAKRKALRPSWNDWK